MSMIIEPFALGVWSSLQNYLLRNSSLFIVVRVVCKLISGLYIQYSKNSLKQVKKF